MKKNLAIYVQGASYISASNKPLKHLIKIFYSIFRTKPDYSSTLPSWLNKSVFKYDQLIDFHWAENISPFAKYRAIEKLSKLLPKYQKKYNLTLIGTSLGGDIVLRAIEQTNCNNINKIFLIGSINETRKIDLMNVKIYNIFSKEDSIQRWATRIIAPFKGSIELDGKNVTNIIVEGLTHSQLHQNKIITIGKYKGKRLSEIIKNNS